MCFRESRRKCLILCGKCSLLNPKTAEWVSRKVGSDASRFGSSGFVVLCDFDGTITSFDTADYILRRFAAGDWELFDRMLDEGKISLEECMVRQFELVHVPERTIIDELEKVATVRPNFSELVHFCDRNGMPFYVVSAGLDFVIYHYLDKLGLRALIKMHSGTSFFDGRKINFSFPRIVNLESKSFKDDLVKSFQRRGVKVVYIGDGLSDLVAARQADIRFAVSGMRLERTLREEGLSFKSFEDFAIVEQELKIMMQSHQ
jgi:2-hydroxy-3-keto-5-methylthiopentenyl-1-phosphate phosphatase